MYEITGRATVTGELDAVWDVVSDVAGWPAWDPHEEAARIDGPFEAGTTGWSKPRHAPGATWELTEVVAPLRWASTCPLPGGRLVGCTEFREVAAGRIECTKRVQVSGPLVPLFRLWYGRRIRRDLGRSFAALEAEIARRRTADAAAAVPSR